jgi:hypothetical protein
MMFCLGATVGRQIDDPCKMRHLAAKSADSMLLNLPHCTPRDLFNLNSVLSIYRKGAF